MSSGFPAVSACRSSSPPSASRTVPAPARPAGLSTPVEDGCTAAKFFTGLPLDGPDPECVHGHGEAALAARSAAPDRHGWSLEGEPCRECCCRYPPRFASARRHAPKPVELARATWPQVEARGGHSILAVPLGSLEQHGPHLPLDTDSRVAVALATGLAAHRLDVAVAPVVAYGASGDARGLPWNAPRRPRCSRRSHRRTRALRTSVSSGVVLIECPWRQ